MKKITIIFFALLSCIIGFSQQETQTNGTWKRAGTASLLFNQAAFNSKWMGGGANNYGGNLSLSYDANYMKNGWTWDNKLLLDYGLTKIDGESFKRKTNDRISLTSTLGKKAGGNWFYSFFANFQTQFTKGYKYETYTRYLLSDFMAPGYFSFGPGMLWKKSDNLKVNISPLTSRFIFTSKDFTQFAPHFGVEEGETFRYELGASVNAYAKFDIMKNVSFENTLNLYSNYLDKPQNIDIDYTGSIVMKVNDYIATSFLYQAIYDDNAVKGIQTRENFGLGLTYKF